MCGLYYVDDSTEEEIDRFIKNRALEKAVEKGELSFHARDIHPTDSAPVMTCEPGKLILRSIKWGIPGFQKGQIIFNARSESTLEKPLFRKGMESGRIVIPAKHFYEWNKRKEKSTFIRLDGRALFMAGFCVGDGMEERFTILTTAANRSMEPVHDRMPLILEEEEIIPWLFESTAVKTVLEKTPCLLERRTDYEQISLFGE